MLIKASLSRGQDKLLFVFGILRGVGIIVSMCIILINIAFLKGCLYITDRQSFTKDSELVLSTNGRHRRTLMLRQLLIVVFAARGSRYFSRTLLLVIADIRVRYRFSCKDLLNPQHANGSSSSGNTVGGVVIFWLLLFSLDIAIGSARILDRSQGSLPPQ